QGDGPEPEDQPAHGRGLPRQGHDQDGGRQPVGPGAHGPDADLKVSTALQPRPLRRVMSAPPVPVFRPRCSPMSDPARLLRRQAYDDGRWIDADGGGTIEVTNPATGEVLATVPDMGAVETRRAVAAAEAAMKPWAAKTAGERARILRRWFDLMMSEQDALGRLLTREQGKSLTEAKGEIAYAASFIEWFAEEGKRTYGEVIPSHDASKRLVTLRQPVGVVGAITPWNFPAAMITRKVGPALAAGCAVVLKPASQTPLSALALAVLAEE